MNLDKERKPTVAGADRVRNFLDSRDKLQRKNETHEERRRLEAVAMRNRKISDDYMSQMARKWHAGDTYSPRDLNPHQINKYKSRFEKDDIVDKLDLNPLDLYKVCPARHHLHIIGYTFWWRARTFLAMSLMSGQELLHDIRIHD